MKKYLKNKLNLTDSGAKGLMNSSISYLFYYMSFAFPVAMILRFADGVLRGQELSIMKFLIFIAISFLVMFYITKINYKTNYNETYKESANIRMDLADKFTRIPLSYFSKHSVADLAQLVLSDVAAFEYALAHAMGSIIGFTLYFIIVMVFLLLANFKLGLCVLGPMLLSIVILFITKRKQIKVKKEHYEGKLTVSDDFQNVIEMHQEINSYGLKEEVSEEVESNLHKTSRVQWKSELAQALPMALSQYIIYFSLGITVVFGLRLLLKDEISIVYLIAYILIAAKTMDGIGGIIQNIIQIFYIDVNIHRIGEITRKHEILGFDVGLNSFDIELENIDFSYQETKVIDDISFKAKQNEVTALVGPSGCGKTTILRLISRLYDYDKGTIKIGGYDINKIKPECLYQYISIVFQDVTLFNTSVMENIRVGNINATDQEVMNAAMLAGCDEFINELPNQYDTLIGENGSKLSGGERQRLSIARAILKDAPIIILDEIAASLDIENEVKIQAGLNTLIKNKTVIIISHRLKSVENVDKIVVLNKGKIDGIGTHKELLKSSEIYKDLIKNSLAIENYRY